MILRRIRQLLTVVTEGSDSRHPDPFWTPQTVRWYLSWWWELQSGTLPRRGWHTLRRPPLHRRHPRDEPGVEAARLRLDLQRALDALAQRDPTAHRAVIAYYCDRRVLGEDHLLRLVHAAAEAYDDPVATDQAWRAILRGTRIMAESLAGLDN